MLIRFLFILITLFATGCTTMHSWSEEVDDDIAKNLPKVNALKYLQSVNLAEKDACIFLDGTVQDKSGSYMRYEDIEINIKEDGKYYYIILDERTRMDKDSYDGPMTLGIFYDSPEFFWLLPAVLAFDVGNAAYQVTGNIFDLLVPDDSCLVIITETEKTKFFTALKSMILK